MAACFKLPSLAKRPKPKTQFPEFEWSEVTVEKELGSGTFGSVYLVKYEKEHRRNVIVKKMKGESAEARRRFEKEAAILKTVKGHRNVTEFLRFCREPYAIMMEHACFDFNPLGVKKQVNSLEDFLHFVDAEFDFTSFADVLLLCARDVVSGLDFLHKNNIAHRDLKPGNTLVCNQHYSKQNDVDLAKSYAECPIVCKLADFGLSRSPDMQTSTFLKPKTESPCRGTPVFMAPDILLEDLKFAGQEDLKKADIWALGLMMFSMINPNLSNPYRAEFEASGVPFSEKALRNTLRQQKLPRPDVKYESFRTTQWWQIDDVFKLCTQFDPESRPTAAEVLRLLDTNQPEASLRLMNLSVNQSSAQTPQDDGTNCCAFLALTICDRFLNEVKLDANNNNNHNNHNNNNNNNNIFFFKNNYFILNSIKCLQLNNNNNSNNNIKYVYFSHSRSSLIQN